MSSSTEPRIPALVGGIPNHSDFAPSILIAVLFALTLIPFLRHFINPNTRTYTFALGTVTYCIERVVVWGVRASQSHNHYPGEVLSKGVLIYQQVSFTLGFTGFAGDTVNFARAVLVNATLEDPKRGSPDEPKQRFWARRFTEFYALAYLAAIIPGAIACTSYSDAADDTQKADRVYSLRYISSAVGLGLLVSFIVCLLWVRNSMKYLDRKGLDVICGLCGVICIIPIYRLAIMHYRTTSLNVIPETGGYPPNSLTNPASKVTFYLFQALPELCCAWFIQTVNLRGLLNTGPFGDWRPSDHKGSAPRLRENGVEVDDVGVAAAYSLTPLTRGSRSFGRIPGSLEDSQAELRDEPVVV